MTEPATNLLPDSFGHAIAGALGHMYRHLPQPAKAAVESDRAAVFMLTLVPGPGQVAGRKQFHAWSHGLALPVELPAGSSVEHARRIAEELDTVPDYIQLLRSGDKLPDDVPILGFGFVYRTADRAASRPARIVFVDLDGQPFLVTESAVEVHPAGTLGDDTALDTETRQLCLYALKITVRAVAHPGNIGAVAHCLIR